MATQRIVQGVGGRGALRGTTEQKHTETCRARLFEAMADDNREEHEEDRGVCGKEGGGRASRSGGLDSRTRICSSKSPSVTKAMMRRTAARTSTAKESENEEGGDEHGPSKKPRQLTWEDMAKKIEYGARASAEDMKINGSTVGHVRSVGRRQQGHSAESDHSVQAGGRGFPRQGRFREVRFLCGDAALGGQVHVLRMAVRRCWEKPCETHKIMLIDVKKAHLNGEVLEDEKVFVLLASEAGGGVARLKQWLHGMRPEAKAGEEYYAAQLTEEAGFRRGISAAKVFWQPRLDVSLMVHGPTSRRWVLSGTCGNLRGR